MRRLAERDTGNYAIELVNLGATGEEYVLRVRYLGPVGLTLRAPASRLQSLQPLRRRRAKRSAK